MHGYKSPAIVFLATNIITHIPKEYLERSTVSLQNTFLSHSPWHTKNLKHIVRLRFNYWWLTAALLLMSHFTSLQTKLNLTAFAERTAKLDLLESYNDCRWWAPTKIGMSPTDMCIVKLVVLQVSLSNGLHFYLAIPAVN